MDRGAHDAQRPHPLQVDPGKAGLGDRWRLVHPRVEEDGKTADTMIHSKVMIVDDRFLRVGSANLNHRSMGADTECDLTIEARNASRAPIDPAHPQSIAGRALRRRRARGRGAASKRPDHWSRSPTRFPATAIVCV